MKPDCAVRIAYLLRVGSFSFILQFILDFWKDNLVMSAVEFLLHYQRLIFLYFWRDNITNLMIKIDFPYKGLFLPYLGLLF